MFHRVLLVLFVLVNSASAVVVQEGDFYEKLIAPDRLDMTGGEVVELIMGNNSDLPWVFNVSGGIIGRNMPSNRDIQLRGGDLNISGGSIEDDVVIASPGTRLTFHGWYFEHFDAGLSNYNYHIVSGWLADGTWIRLGTQNEFEQRGDIKVEFVIEPSNGITGDVNGDWLVDIADLNLVRNEFGAAFDIEDLNDVRNNFGKGGPFFSAGTPGVEIHSQSSVATPEPSSLLLMALGAGLLAGIPLRCRYWSRPRRCL